MEKVMYTKADCMSATQAAKKYNVDKDKLERVMKKLYINGKKIPGKPLKTLVNREAGVYRMSGEPVAHKAILEEYNKVYPSR